MFVCSVVVKDVLYEFSIFKGKHCRGQMNAGDTAHAVWGKCSRF